MDYLTSLRTLPSIEDTADAVLASALMPVVRDLATRSGQVIELRTCSLAPYPVEEKVVRVGEVAGEGMLAKGEVRMILRGAAHRYNFVLEAIFARLALDSGYSGITMQGRIHWDEGQAVVEVVTQAARYNTWEWTREFRA
ncbi:hypothetical protein [Pinirhizobacter soli]|uniref:hypothetical protein n=1 Tax=Pinirhizobacter soli TaxID=2786953 RepID=UPI00202AA0F6|nr:hypothetical protein [Pinirhizobacter soli]